MILNCETALAPETRRKPGPVKIRIKVTGLEAEDIEEEIEQLVRLVEPLLERCEGGEGLFHGRSVRVVAVPQSINVEFEIQTRGQELRQRDFNAALRHADVLVPGE